MKKSFLKLTGLALAAVLVLGMFSCSNGSNDDPVFHQLQIRKPSQPQHSVLFQVKL